MIWYISILERQKSHSETSEISVVSDFVSFATVELSAITSLGSAVVYIIKGIIRHTNSYIKAFLTHIPQMNEHLHQISCSCVCLWAHASEAQSQRRKLSGHMIQVMKLSLIKFLTVGRGAECCVWLARL